MKIIVLGTAGYHPSDRRETACLLLPELGVIFDAGTSFYRVPDRLETSEVDFFITHSHLDHVIGLTFFLVPLFTGQVTKARVHATPKTIEAVQTHLFNDAMFPVNPPYDYQPLTDDYRLADGGVVSFIEQEHPGGSLGYKVTWPDRSFAYLSDTFCDGSSTEFVRGVDVLIHECNFKDGQEDWAKTTGHSTPTPVLTMARDANVGRLYLLHFDPLQSGDDPIDLESVKHIFPKTVLAEDLMEIEF